MMPTSAEAGSDAATWGLQVTRSTMRSSPPRGASPALTTVRRSPMEAFRRRRGASIDERYFSVEGEPIHSPRGTSDVSYDRLREYDDGSTQLGITTVSGLRRDACSARYSLP